MKKPKLFMKQREIIIGEYLLAKYITNNLNYGLIIFAHKYLRDTSSVPTTGILYFSEVPTHSHWYDIGRSFDTYLLTVLGKRNRDKTELDEWTIPTFRQLLLFIVHEWRIFGKWVHRTSVVGPVVTRWLPSAVG